MIPSPIFVAGSRGLAGSAVCRRLEREPGVRLLSPDRASLDLRDENEVLRYFEKEKPGTVIFASGKVGGIHANQTYPVEFFSENIQQALATIHTAFVTRVKRFVFLGSTCIYPRDAMQPIKESELLSGPLEPTNEAYALAKIACLKLCQYYRRQYGVMFHSVMPTNLYGPGDNYHPVNNHVLPSFIRRFHEAKQVGAPSVKIWGTGSPRREFLHSDDLADAIIHLCKIAFPPDWVNIGTGKDITILELAELVAEIIGYQGTIENDLTKPDGAPRKCSDVSLLKSLGWEASISLREGIESTYQNFLDELSSARLRTS